MRDFSLPSLPTPLVLKYASKRNSVINSLISHFERIPQVLRYFSKSHGLWRQSFLDPCYVMYCDSRTVLKLFRILGIIYVTESRVRNA